jgi:hypothetical protein
MIAAPPCRDIRMVIRNAFHMIGSLATMRKPVNRIDAYAGGVMHRKNSLNKH